MRALIAALVLLPSAVAAQVAPPPPMTSAAPAPTAAAPIAVPARTILFVGNSFTQGAHSALRNWRAERVTDLNGAGYGGVPALFKTFTDEVGLNYLVSLETQGGKTLGFHYAERHDLLDRAWDVVVLQELSTLSRSRPGDATAYVADVSQLARMFAMRNPQVRIELMATWSRADETYRGRGPWAGKPIYAMATDLRTAAERARAAEPRVGGVLPVGEAWNLAMSKGVADPDPYDGTTFGQVDLWTYDHYHGSVAGYYLEALVVFGRITGVDPRRLGRDERAADELGLSKELAASLQEVASEQLAREAASGRPS
jgi:hypothetical protein